MSGGLVLGISGSEDIFGVSSIRGGEKTLPNHEIILVLFQKLKIKVVI